MNYLIMFLPAVLVTLFFKFYWKKDITNKEALLGLGANLLSSAVMCGIFAAYVSGQAWDHNIISGYVTGKQQVRVSCEHSYSCNCYQSCSGTGSNRTCTQICSTCYDHINDWDWDVFTTIGTFTISRVDRRGSNEPKRWTIVQKGETVNDTRRFQNWLLVDETNLFLQDKTAARYPHPAYPSIYDYYRMTRAFGNPVTVKLNEVQAHLDDYAEKRQDINIIAVFTDKPELYFYSLMQAWKGGKQKDVIMVFGMQPDGKIGWFMSNTYAKGMNNREMHELLGNEARNKTFSKEVLTSLIGIVNNKFRVVDATQFEFKKESVKIPFGLMLFAFLLNLATSIGLSIYFKKENVI